MTGDWRGCLFCDSTRPEGRQKLWLRRADDKMTKGALSLQARPRNEGWEKIGRLSFLARVGAVAYHAVLCE